MQIFCSRIWASMAVPALFLLMAGCSSSPEIEGTSPKAPDQYKVKFETSKGDFVVEVIREWSPLGADRFHELVKAGFYDGNRFFRVLPGFIVQFGLNGDPAANARWAEARIGDDPPGQSNRPATITFATSGPSSRTSQVFINLADNSRLDSQGFTPFGRIVEGMSVAASFFSGYGEGFPRGAGPDQSRIRTEGNAYLQRDFPMLDYVKKASIQ